MQGRILGLGNYFDILEYSPLTSGNGTRKVVLVLGKKTSIPRRVKRMKRNKKQMLTWVVPALARAVEREARARGMTKSGVVSMALMRVKSIREYAAEDTLVGGGR